MAKLLILTPEGPQERELAQTNTLGRHPNNTIQLLDRIVSKEHCTIDYRSGRFVLRDLGSLNGTYINGQRVQGEAALKDMDEVSLGNTRLVFRETSDADLRGMGRLQGAPPVAPQAPQSVQPQGGYPAPAPAPNHLAPLSPPAMPQRPAGFPQGPNPIGGGPHLGPPQQPVGFGQAPKIPAQQGGVMGGHTLAGQGGFASNVGQTSQGLGPQQNALAAMAMAQRSKVTIAAGVMESHVRAKLMADQQLQFLPEQSITDTDVLRRDYEKLRISYELTRDIGAELDLDRLLDKILERAFEFLAADRGVVLLKDDAGELKPRAVRNRRATNNEEAFVVSTSMLKQVEQERLAVLSSDAMVDPRFSQAHSIIMQGIRSSMAVPLLHKSELLGVMILDSQISTNAFTEKDLKLFSNIATQAALFIENAKLVKKSEQEAIARERFQRLLSPQVASLVLSGKVEVKQGGEPRETTMLFSDIRGFTSMSEGMRAEDIVSMLNEYFESMVEILFRHEGTLDKFVGDEIMALFGAPVDHPDDPVRAVRAAIEMIQSLQLFNATRAAAGKQGFEIGIGINTGSVVAGYLGSSKAMQYTVIGAPVNLAARLCSAAKGMQVIISEATWLRVREQFEVRELEPVKPKGIGSPVRIFEVLRERSEDGVSIVDEETTMLRPNPTAT